MRWLLLGVTWALTAASAAAADAPEGSLGSGRTVGDHAFAGFHLLPYPFVTTRARAASTLGYTTLVKPEADGFLGLLDREASFTPLEQRFEVDLAALPWLGVEVGGAGGLLMATNLPGLVRVGAAAHYAGNLGLVAAYETGSWLVSGRVDGAIGQRAGLTPSTLTLDRLRRRSLITSGRTLDGGGAASVVFGVNEVLGLQAGVRFRGASYEIVDDLDVSGSALDGGLGLSIAVGPARLQIADAVGHRFGDVPPPGTVPFDDTWNRAEIGVYALPRATTDIGLSGIVLVSDDERRLVGVLSLASYF